MNQLSSHVPCACATQVKMPQSRALHLRPQTKSQGSLMETLRQREKEMRDSVSLGFCVCFLRACVFLSEYCNFILQYWEP
jgi:hypothetical protein